MYYRIIRNDISKSRLITLTITLFIAAAAMLVSLAAVLVVNLFGAIDTLMTKAETPHFMQMHSGAIDFGRLEAFAQENPDVDEFQVLEFLNVDGARIVLDQTTLADSVQDNGFCIQSETFDYLLDLDGKVIQVSDGEIYVPVSYRKDGIAKVGGKVSVGEQEFVIAGFLRDSQMNSLLASSKRFLVSENDYTKIKALGSIEYLIEFRLKELSELDAFQTAYTAAGLEANGPTITYPLFKTINAISDGLMIAVILLVSILVVAMAFMCIRFTLMAKIEEDYREIGIMKAIGLSLSHIKKLYFAKYAAISLAGCLSGFALSFLFRGMLLENIRLYMGESGNSLLALLVGIMGVLLVFAAILAYVGRVLKRFRKISAAQAMRFGVVQEEQGGKRNFCLSKNRLFDTNIFLGIQDVLTRKRLYATMLAVLVLSAFIIIVPQNLYNTISSKDFILYMGIGSYDMRLDIQQTDDIPQKAAEIARVMESDSDILKYAVFTTKSFQAKTQEGLEENIKIELGDHSLFPIKYAEGRAPIAENEIALSMINADELGKKIGDAITLVIEGKERQLTVCGIYSDITNGGKTAKAVFADNSADIMWCIVCAQLLEPSYINEKVSEYGQSFEFAKVTGVEGFIWQTFGSTINSIKKASYGATVAALIITILITLLFIKMLVAKDRYSIAVMKALGFTSSDIRVQYASRSISVLLVGIIAGTLLANTLGEVLAGMVISSFGAASFQFTVNPLSAYLLCPLMMVCAVLIAAITGTSDVEQIKIWENIKE
ncbi:ABC transporter permease [Konateibacter massiliensis]|uniref:ABC transporter permease n=1 Tax=Konateibacter massiliensis TaxID=2002841 RepID=UPI000C154914|nr:ABC transporter permease [Konateibacter massiliensis]